MTARLAPAWPAAMVAGAAVGFAEFRATYTVRTWLSGWLVRMVAQVVFYTSIGSLIGDADRRLYLLVGASVSTMVAEVMLTCGSTSREQRAGTLALLVATPAPLLAILTGRSMQWLPSALLTSSFCLVAVGPLFGLDLDPRTAAVSVGVLAAATVGTYGMALFLSAVILRAPGMRNLAGALTASLTFAISGAAVPVAFWPGWVEVLSAALPATHALAALRTVLAGGDDWVVGLGLTLAVGAAWLVLCWLVLRRTVARGRMNGSVVVEP